MKIILTLLVMAGVVCLSTAPLLGAASLAQPLATIRSVGPEGRGNAEASLAWRIISQSEAGELPAILMAMNGANDLALNWLRTAVDTLAARALAGQKSLPVARLERFLRNTRNDPQPRRLAYELIARTDPARSERLIVGMVNDPGSELRRDAVQRRMDRAVALRQSGNTNGAIVGFQSVLPSARDVDQVETIARCLRELGQTVELPKVFGWISAWSVIGPFDNIGGAGFDRVYPPEERVELGSEHDGKTGKVRWTQAQAHGDYGIVDMNKACGTLKGVTGYAYTEFEVARVRPVEVRLGCKTAWKVWLNGKLLQGRDEYHRGVEIDQYRLTGVLKSGRNSILVKICQNEQTEDWTVEWEFQLRLTDALGTPIALLKP